METRTEGIASAERSRHVFRHDALATADRSSPVLPVDLLHDSCPPVDDRQHLVGLLGREHRHHAGDANPSKKLIKIGAKVVRLNGPIVSSTP
jgi:hypothetical protein